MKPWIEKSILVIIGIILTHIWNKLKSRIVYLHYSVWHQPLGTSVNDNLFGDVQILYNKTPVNSLYFSTVTIENHSSKDIQDLELNIYCDSTSSIMVSHGYLDYSPNALKFTDEYAALLEKAKTDQPTAITALGRRDYKVPILNRGEVIKIQLLMTNPNKQPEVYVNSEHPGLKMKFSKKLRDFWGESAKYCASIGSIVALLLTVPLINYVPSEFSYLSVIAGTILGLVAMILGWLFIKLIKTTMRIIG